MADAPSDSDNPRKRTGVWGRLSRVLGRERIGSADAVAEALRESESSGELIEGAQKDMILRAARFDRLSVADVMRPRAEIVAIEASASLGEAARAFSDSQHSRLPIYGETLDDPQGFVHVRDVMSLLAPNAEGEASAKFSDQLLDRLEGLVIGSNTGDQLDHPHRRHGVHEVHPDKLLRPIGASGETRDWN